MNVIDAKLGHKAARFDYYLGICETQTLDAVNKPVLALMRGYLDDLKQICAGVPPENTALGRQAMEQANVDDSGTDNAVAQ